MVVMLRTSRLSLAASALVATTALTACGSGSSNSGSGDKVETVASFYTLQYALERIGGDRVEVSSLTKPGQEPHDIDPSPKQIASLADADLAVYLKGFQPSVDAAVSSNAKKDKTLDVAPDADMTLKLSSTESVGGEAHEHSEGDGHDHSGDTDPHFWLDPVRYKAVVQAVGARLAKADPEGKATYEANTKKMVADLDALNTEFKSGLANCTNKTLVTGHAAFGYLASRYGFTQVGVSGVSPEAEPTPQRLKAVAAFAKKHDTTTIYSETLVSPKTAETVAKQTGAKVAVLDPLEGLTDASKGKNYFEVMKSNLTTLKQGQGCK
ncbi:ABC transporter substrate-binding protein [Dermacoccus sp. PE3]|nr:ABC transporter substrate-binding protein [Dermacoccus sp. PE3]